MKNRAAYRLLARFIRSFSWAGWLALALAWPQAIYGQSYDQRFAEGLRQRRLYDLAETFCRQQLNRSQLDPLQQTELLLELTQTQVARASSLPLDQQPAAWNAARETLAEFLLNHPSHPRREVFVVQHGLTLLARGQTLRREWEIAGEQIELRHQASRSLREAVAELEAADRMIAELLPVRQRQRKDLELSTAQLMALQNNVQFQLAQCDLNRALLYGDEEKSTQVDALVQIEERLKQLSRRIQPGDPLAAAIALLHCECQRRLNRFAEAESVLASIDPQQLSSELLGEFWSERIQVALAQQKTGEAIGWLPQVGSFFATSPKLCLSMLELFLAMADQSTNDADRLNWQHRAEQVLKVVETHHGLYWTRRANLLLFRNATVAAPATSADLMVRMVDELVRKDRADEALQLLDLAGAQAAAENRADTAIALAWRAAQIQQQRGRHQDASDRFRLISQAFAESSEAPAAHLAACWNVAQQIPAQADLLPEYIRLLREHLERWPSGPTTDQAAVWLAPLLARQQQWRDALNAVTRVQPTSSEFPRAVDWACTAAVAELSQAAAQAETRAERMREVVELLNKWIAAAESAAGADMAALGKLKMTRSLIELRFGSADAARPAGELQSLVQDTRMQNADWHDQAVAWLALCRAIGGESGVEVTGARLDPSTAAVWLEVARSRVDEGNRKPIAELIVAQYARIADEISKQDIGMHVRWQIAVAESLWDIGDRDRAVERMTALAQQFPRQLEVQLHFARLLDRDPQGQWAELAAAAWRTVAAGSESRSDVWYEAKLGLARALVAGDHIEEAEKVLLYLKTVPPGWEQSPLKNEFEQLLAECRRRK